MAPATDGAIIPGYATASPIMQTILGRLLELGEVRSLGAGRWLATCPCCSEPLGMEVADVYRGATLTPRGREQ
jgi:hypothetical protein